LICVAARETAAFVSDFDDDAIGDRIIGEPGCRAKAIGGASACRARRPGKRQSAALGLSFYCQAAG